MVKRCEYAIVEAKMRKCDCYVVCISPWWLVLPRPVNDGIHWRDLETYRALGCFWYRVGHLWLSADVSKCCDACAADFMRRVLFLLRRVLPCTLARGVVCAGHASIRLQLADLEAMRW